MTGGVAVAEGVAVAVVGATGLVGEALLAVLTEREFPISELFALGRDDIDDATVLFADRPKHLQPLSDFDFSRCRFAFFCTPAAVSAEHVRRAVKSGCTVIDVSRQFRLDNDVPLIVADANAQSLPGKSGLIAGPSAEVIQLAAVLAPIQQVAGLRSVDVTTMLAVSDRGRAGIGELAGQTARLLNVQSIESKVFDEQIAFNLLSQTDAPAVAAELQKVLGNSGLAVDSSSQYVPVFYGHTQVVRIETATPLSADAARKLLRKAPGVHVQRQGDFPTPVGDAVGGDNVLVGQVRELAGRECGLLLWTLADNVRKSAAVNSVQIAETLLKAHL